MNKNDSNNSRWLTQQQTAEYLGCSVRQLQHLVRDGRMPVSYALGPRSPRYDRYALDEMLAAGAVHEPSP